MILAQKPVSVISKKLRKPIRTISRFKKDLISLGKHLRFSGSGAKKFLASRTPIKLRLRHEEKVKQRLKIFMTLLKLLIMFSLTKYG